MNNTFNHSQFKIEYMAIGSITSEHVLNPYTIFKNMADSINLESKEEQALAYDTFANFDKYHTGLEIISLLVSETEKSPFIKHHFHSRDSHNLALDIVRLAKFLRDFTENEKTQLFPDVKPYKDENRALLDNREWVETAVKNFMLMAIPIATKKSEL